MRYCFLDIETTGFEPEQDSLIELSFVITDENFVEIDRLDTLIRPEKSPLNPFVTKLTGITENLLHTEARAWSEVLPQAQEKIGSATIIGHNIGFDIGFLVAYGLPIQKNPWIDTHQLSRILLVNEESYSLETLAQKYGFVHESAHRAMSDVEANIELYVFLLEKINALPSAYLRTIQPWLERADWDAGALFLRTEGADQIPERIPSQVSCADNTPSLDSEIQNALTDATPQSPLWIRMGENKPAIETILSLAQTLSQQGKSVALISPKLHFFPEFAPVPLPEVLFDPERFEVFCATEKDPTPETLTFLLKCAYRHILGYHGKNWFDLFLYERDLWREVNIRDRNHPIFEAILKERKNKPLISLSPLAYKELRATDLMRDRVLIVDEAEEVTAALLFAASRTYSLAPYLQSNDQRISVAAQFFVTNFCREVVEPALRRPIGTFPEKIPLRADTYPEFAKQLETFCSYENLSALQDLLTESDSQNIRWVTYLPERGNLSFGRWDHGIWEELKADFRSAEKICFHRHRLSEKHALFETFLGLKTEHHITPENLQTQKALRIPDNIPSANAPAYLDFVEGIIRREFQQAKDKSASLAVNFSSLDTLRKIHERFAVNWQDDVALLGEKVAGGDGKLLQLMQTPAPKLFLYQKLETSAFWDILWQKLLVQKFPFTPPHPLFTIIEERLKQNGLSFWDIWTVPSVAANLSRRIANMPSAHEVIFLDPKHNAGWGKDILQLTF